MNGHCLLPSTQFEGHGPRVCGNRKTPSMARGAISLAAIPSMASLVNLSNELLIQISDYLYRPDLEYFAFLSPRIFNVCQQRIEEHQQSRNNHRRKDQTRWRMGHPDLSWTDVFNEMCRLDYAPYVQELILERRTGVGVPALVLPRKSWQHSFNSSELCLTYYQMKKTNW